MKFNKSLINITKVVLIISIFFYGFLSGTKKIFPYNEIKKIYYFFKKNVDNFVISKNFENCDLKKLVKIPTNSTVVIGHAYGSTEISQNEEAFISKKVLKFLNQNKNRIEKVIFSGDVFGIPTITKWKKLDNDFKDYFSIDIAPGNHDIGNQYLSEIFKLTKFGKKNYPYKVFINSNSIIIENSFVNKWRTHEKILDFMQNNENKITIVRHNIPIKELIRFANPSRAPQELDNFDLLKKKINSRKEITWIIGDSGGYKYLPRIKCLKKENHRFILNGIGDANGDSVIIINNDRLYKFQI